MIDLDFSTIRCGSVTAPAGCGKTQLIADTLKDYVSDKPALVLTHTNAGKGALEARLAKAGVPKCAYRVATIDSWAIRLISKFPARSGHNPSILKLENPGRDYPAIRNAAWRLLSQNDITDALQATYSCLIVDEYQDCTLPQHNIIGWAANTLSTRVLGDPLQAIFGFREATVDWQTDVHRLFPPLGQLQIPWRWRNAGAEALGQWLLDIRQVLLSGHPLDLREAPPEVTWVPLDTDPSTALTQRIEAARTRAPGNGTVLVIGDSTSPHGQRQVASLTPGAITVEAVDLRDLTEFGRSFEPRRTNSLNTLLDFASKLMTNLDLAELKRRLISLRENTAHKEATEVEAAALAFLEAPSFCSALEVMRMLREKQNVRVYRPDVLHVCLSAMRMASSGESTFYDAVVQAREKNRHLGRPVARRAVGSTLLLKGLEADVVVVLSPENMNAKHLYVALTRGAKQVVICSSSPILVPRE